MPVYYSDDDIVDVKPMFKVTALTYGYFPVDLGEFEDFQEACSSLEPYGMKGYITHIDNNGAVVYDAF